MRVISDGEWTETIHSVFKYPNATLRHDKCGYGYEYTWTNEDVHATVVRQYKKEHYCSRKVEVK